MNDVCEDDVVALLRILRATRAAYDHVRTASCTNKIHYQVSIN